MCFVKVTTYNDIQKEPLNNLFWSSVAQLEKEQLYNPFAPLEISSHVIGQT